ncbi:hypothetical protein [Haliscomenobacter hydrossis]|nr:hypothetical protein [Haliscomenobacter hydrossis]
MERKIKIVEAQDNFVQGYAKFGFHNVDEMIGYALDLLKQELETKQKLAYSADLYAELYELDIEAHEWVEAATLDVE